MIPLTNTDVLIIGGGPAGASAAISLMTYGKASVTLVEQSDLDQPRIGESVSSSIFDLLNYLKLLPEDFEEGCFLKNNGTTSYWGSEFPVTRDAIFSTEKPGCQLDRAVFDLTLLKKIADLGGLILPRTKCIGFEQLPDHTWSVMLDHKTQGKCTIKAKFLIDATGRQGSVSRQMGLPAKKNDQLVGVGAFLQISDRILPNDHMIESTPLGWWYSSTLNHNYSATVFFSDADIIAEKQLHKGANWVKLLEDTKFIRNRINGYHEDDLKPWVRSAHTHITDIRGQVNFLAIGDAVASFDPISSMGIGFSISSGMNAAAVTLLELEENNAERINTYQSDVDRIFGNYMALQKKFYRQETRWSDSIFWARRNRSS